VHNPHGPSAVDLASIRARRRARPPQAAHASQNLKHSFTKPFDAHTGPCYPMPSQPSYGFPMRDHDRPGDGAGTQRRG
jgi:hypothetical protein